MAHGSRRNRKGATVHAGPFVNVEAVAATCTEKGATSGTKCTACGVVISGCESTDALGHDISVKVSSVAPTCTNEGYTVYKCSRCDATEKRDILPALGHTPVTVAGKTPTCTESGLTDGVVCEVCKTVITAQETVPALGHSDADNDNTCDICGATIKKLTFIDKLKAFFQKIIDWFKNLFK